MAFLLAAVGIAWASHTVCESVIMPAGRKFIDGIGWMQETPQRIKARFTRGKKARDAERRRSMIALIRKKYAFTAKHINPI